MSDAANNLIHQFSALPSDERYAVLIELARISEVDAGAIADDELTHAGEQLFAMYDAEEAENGTTDAG